MHWGATNGHLTCRHPTWLQMLQKEELSGAVSKSKMSYLLILLHGIMSDGRPILCDFRWFSKDGKSGSHPSALSNTFQQGIAFTCIVIT